MWFIHMKNSIEIYVQNVLASFYLPKLVTRNICDKIVNTVKRNQCENCDIYSHQKIREINFLVTSLVT